MGDAISTDRSDLLANNSIMVGVPIPLILRVDALVIRAVAARLGLLTRVELRIEAIASCRLDLSPLITARISFDQVVSGGIEELLNNRDAHVKSLVHP